MRCASTWARLLSAQTMDNPCAVPSSFHPLCLQALQPYSTRRRNQHHDNDVGARITAVRLTTDAVSYRPLLLSRCSSTVPRVSAGNSPNRPNYDKKSGARSNALRRTTDYTRNNCIRSNRLAHLDLFVICRPTLARQQAHAAMRCANEQRPPPVLCRREGRRKD